MNNTWTFDDSVAVRFQHEAESHIPSYHTVIEKCINFAIKNLQKTDLIIDVGSALGFTIKKFKDLNIELTMTDFSESILSEIKYK